MTTKAQQQAIALANARRRQAQGPGQTEGTPLGLDGDLAPPPAPRTIGQTIRENIIGEGAVDTPGEMLGEAIQQGGRGIIGGAAALGDLATAPFRSAAQRIRAGIEGGVEAMDVAPGAGIEALQGPLTRAAEPVTSVQPESTAGEFARTAGEFVPGAAAFGGVSPASLMRGAIAPGVGSELAGQLTEGTEIEPAARVAGALAGPVVAQGAANVARRAISPAGGADPARLEAAQRLQAEGVKVTAGQATNNETQMFREAATKAGREIAEQQADQFTAAALRRIGVSASKATPEVLNKAADDIGKVFDDVGRGVSVPVSQGLLQKVGGAVREYGRLTTKANQAPVVAQLNKKLISAFRTGQPVSSKEIMTFRSDLSKLTRSPDAATRDAALKTLNAIDDELSGTLQNMGRAEDVSRLATARQQWANLKAIENAVSRAGEKSALGVITPQNLRNALAVQNRTGFVRGRGDLNQLARDGVVSMPNLPQSGTQPRLGARELFSGGTAATATGLGSVGLGVDPATAVAIGAAAAAGPRLRNAFLASPAGQQFMKNQLVQPGSPLLTPIPGAISGSTSGLLSQ